MEFYRTTRQIEKITIPDEEFFEKVNQVRKEWNEEDDDEFQYPEAKTLEDIEIEDLEIFEDMEDLPAVITDCHEMYHKTRDEAYDDMEWGIH